MTERPVVRVYQEDWWPFQNLPVALRRLDQDTGIKTELSWDVIGIGLIDTMFDNMTRSFADDDPPYDLVCTDELMLRHYASMGRVQALDDFIARDGYDVGPVTAATDAVTTWNGQTIGLPCVNVTNMLLYRSDLFDRYGFSVPNTFTEVGEIGAALQEAVRADTKSEFFAFATRGADGGGHAVWTISSFMRSHGARWFDESGRPDVQTDQHREALETYVDLLHRTAPPDEPEMTFPELTRDYRSGRVGMILEVGMEYANIFHDDADLAERSGVALIPAGPAGRFPNLYCPPFAIPARSKVKDEAWEVAKFLCSPEQLLDDGIASNALETSSLTVLYSPEFDRHYRDDLLSVARASRSISFEERPVSDLGLDACVVVGNATNAALRGTLTVDAALAAMQTGLDALVAKAPAR